MYFVVLTILYISNRAW